MENNQSPSDSWQRPGGSAETTPTGSVPPQSSGPLPQPGGFAPPQSQPAAPFAVPASRGPEPTSVYDPYVPAGGPQLGAPVPNEAPKRKSKLGVFAGVAAVVALGAGGIFFVASSSGKANGGAESPEAVASQLLDAIDNDDVLGMVDTLLPGERELARQPLIEYVNELTRLEVLAPVDLSSLNGVTFTVQERNIVAEPTNVSDITNVSLDGSIEIVMTGAEMPIGPLIEEFASSEELADMRASTETEVVPFDFEITTVEQDGRWYISMGYTAAEAARQQAGLPDIPETGVGATGSDSPEAAFNLLLTRVADLDLTGMVQTLNPGEAGALQRYAPLFIGEAQQALDAELAGVAFNFEFTTPEVRTDIDGDRATLFVDQIGITGDVEGTSFNVDFNGECVHGNFDGEEFNECGRSLSSGDLDDFGLFDGYPEVDQFMTDLQASFADVRPIGIEFARTNGEWYISPVSTYVQGTLTFMRALDATELRTLIDDAIVMLGQFDRDMMEAIYEIDDIVEDYDDDSYDDYSYDDDSYHDDSYDDDSYDDSGYEDSASADAVTDSTSVDDEPASEVDAVSAALDDCYSRESFDDAAACFQTAIDNGTISADYVPTEVAYPDCGRSLWDVTTLSDEEFTAAVGAAAACFQPLVDQGQLTADELPEDVRALACFEGRNPYTVVEDDYYDRLDACYADIVG